MVDFNIGLTGLTVAQKAIELAGMNITNASTPGYHRQELEVASVNYAGNDPTNVGAGAQVTGIRRYVDQLLETQLLQQQPVSASTDQTLTVMQGIEASLGDLESGGLATAMNNYYSALRDLAGQPTSQAYQQQLLWSADDLCTQFRSLGNNLNDVLKTLAVDAGSLIQQANQLTQDIATDNQSIVSSAAHSGSANSLTDLRDQAVSDLSGLMKIDVVPSASASGASNVIQSGTLLVNDSLSTPLALSTQPGDLLAIAPQGSQTWQTSNVGGRLGAVIDLHNSIVSDLKSKLDTLANQVMLQVNQVHSQALGQTGSFTSLEGWRMPSSDPSQWNPPLADGHLYIRLTDQTTGQITRNDIAISHTDTLDQIAANITAAGGVTASVLDGRLTLAADPNYKFDFLPGTIPDVPASLSNMTGTAEPTIGGDFAGSASGDYDCVISGGGTVGVTSGLKMSVSRDGILLDTFNIGQGYAAGDALALPDGLQVKLNAGTVNDGDSFTIQALATSDSSHLLAAAGMNAFFTGQGASTMAVRADLLANPDLLGTSLTDNPADNSAVQKLLDQETQTLDGLGGNTATGYFQLLVTDVGQNVSILQARQTTNNSIIHELQNQQDAISGVDINTEAAKLVMYQQMYQGVAKVIQAQSATLKSLIDMMGTLA